MYYTNYIHPHIDENDALETNDDINVYDITVLNEIAARILDCIMAQHNLPKGLMLYGK